MNPAHRLLEAITASWGSHAIRAAAELRLLDALLPGPRSSEDLAAVTGTHAPSLLRLLRALAALDLCRELPDGAFALTPTGTLLAADVPGSLRSWALWWTVHLGPVWDQLLYSVRTGKSARAMLTGTEGFAHLERSPEAAEVFNRALAELTGLACRDVLSACDFAGVSIVVDVGGGYGQLLAAVLAAHPGVRGVLFDLPHALEGARGLFEKAGLLDRCRFETGDFFTEVPGGGDVYLLKSVIHDWDDDRARALLVNCRRALAPEARLLLVEQVLPARWEATPTHRALARSDLTMLVAHAARERTAEEFQALLASAGLAVTQVVPAGPTFSVLEAVARRGRP